MKLLSEKDITYTYIHVVYSYTVYNYITIIYNYIQLYRIIQIECYFTFK